MSLLLFAKEHFTEMPYPVGAALSRIPYAWKPGVGGMYRKRVREIAEMKAVSSFAKRAFILERMIRLVQHAENKVPFYRDLYKKEGFCSSDLTSFDALKRIPIVSKSQLQEYVIEDRSDLSIGNRFLANTGGSSGKPLGFYVESSSIGHERAHMYDIWARLGFVPSDYTLTFGGRSKLKSPIQYDSLRHAFNVNIYEDFDRIRDLFLRLCRKRSFKYLHGYPSAIFDFARYCDDKAPEVRDVLRSSLKGVFFGSEYPQPQWRDEIEAVFGAPTISWYGHTERCVLAHEDQTRFEFHPFLTYGFAEAVREDSETFLVGTAFYNYVSPLIRYNTEDVISAVSEDEGILEHFRIDTGRRGDFVLDEVGKRIPLTGLIFGRHHELFNHCSHIQISQEAPGRATVYYCEEERSGLRLRPEELFDASGVSIAFDFVKIEQPIKSISGKVTLLVNPDLVKTLDVS